jgi:hypothetical protein
LGSKTELSIKETEFHQRRLAMEIAARDSKAIHGLAITEKAAIRRSSMLKAIRTRLRRDWRILAFQVILSLIASSTYLECL